VGEKGISGDFRDLIVWGSNFLGEHLKKSTGEFALASQKRWRLLGVPGLQRHNSLNNSTLFLLLQMGNSQTAEGWIALHILKTC
jgi:hypothetical protein